jgi:hypothetical protein
MTGQFRRELEEASALGEDHHSEIMGMSGIWFDLAPFRLRSLRVSDS